MTKLMDLIYALKKREPLNGSTDHLVQLEKETRRIGKLLKPKITVNDMLAECVIAD